MILILVISAAVVILSISTKSSGVPNIFGFAPLSVQSDSMSPTFNDGDLIIGKVIDHNNSGIKVGDVVTFPVEIGGEKTLNTHRVVDMTEDDGGGLKYYVTQGDNKVTNPTPDFTQQTDQTIVAKWTGKKIPGFGKVLTFLRTRLGFFLCILLPMILFFVYETIRVILNVMAYKKEKAIEDAAGDELTEEQKQRAIAEYLAQQQAQTPEQDSGGEVQTPASGGAQSPETDSAENAGSTDD